ncbi:MAG: methylated-DNA--[protein]-cysteine S-methyltransferase [Thermodesulfobacteriaceae bacterium]|nr:methylated-DNA--[protein]-cysteine S-methyltransferase [Thermodesulfobacteriaceae bacterium]MCX8041123.1 methylated-DNA--[protein]-cysteine S-methyltransferase [Thermodesulfobacteriaceae bacterium]MDW8135844.1 methylated-DNA--[protein]-cysteine S-methyltransferase [Thermodesulfobacterium sp.]
MSFKAILSVFPLKFYLIWDQEGNLLKLNLAWDFNLVSQVIFYDNEKAQKFCKAFWEALWSYWNFKTPFINVKHRLIGTELEKKVLLGLREIKIGKVKRYKDLAEEVGISKGYRWIGKILAKNPLPLVYPCHRVIGSKNLGGYSQGFLIKQFLLYRELEIIR